MLCYLSLPVCAPAACSACGTCFLLIWYSRSHWAHAFLHQSWAGFVWGGGISFLCKQREICTSLVGIAVIVLGVLLLYSKLCHILFASCQAEQNCSLGPGPTLLITVSSGGVNLFVFTHLLFVLIRKRENNLFLHIYVF